MRYTAWLLAALAATAAPQWRHFGQEAASFSRDMLARHNAVRSSVGAPPLAWSDRLASRAQQWADALLPQHRLAHSKNSPYGENLFEITGASASPSEVVGDWAGEVRHYNYSSGKCDGVCGHYTQIVWRDTKEVGCAVARGQRREVWVCEYDPPGNWVGRRPY